MPTSDSRRLERADKRSAVLTSRRRRRAEMPGTTNAGDAAYIKGNRRQRGGSLGEDFAREVHPVRHRAWSGRRLRLAGRLRRGRRQLRRRFRRWELRRRGFRWRLRRWQFGWRWLRWRLEEIVRR